MNSVVAERVAGMRHLSISASSPAYGSTAGAASLSVKVWRDSRDYCSGDHDGRADFDSSDAAFAFALEHGYLRRYFTAPSLRLRRILRAQGFGHSFEAAVHELEPRDILERIARWRRTREPASLFPGSEV